ncbi:MAG: hypothetical protein QNJ46_33775 [Leptolyngbyaceae cyanobacterium MO_188.B28]|nr:hypothetical protein [Leptolyngbyaceae cyanobacterium MO_188.B28]
MIAASTTLATSAAAQLQPIDTLPEAAEDIINHDSGNSFSNRSIGRQIQFIFGFGGITSAGFADLEIQRDTEAFHQSYLEWSALQNTSDPYLRVPDLRNPYNTSVQLIPTSQINSRAIGGELVFERLPIQ